MAMEKLLTEAVADALARHITVAVIKEMNRQYAPMLTELTEARQTNMMLCREIAELKQQQNFQSKKIAEAIIDFNSKLDKDKAVRQKSLQLLNEALEDLGLT